MFGDIKHLAISWQLSPHAVISLCPPWQQLSRWEKLKFTSFKLGFAVSFHSNNFTFVIRGMFYSYFPLNLKLKRTDFENGHLINETPNVWINSVEFFFFFLIQTIPYGQFNEPIFISIIFPMRAPNEKNIFSSWRFHGQQFACISY